METPTHSRITNHYQSSDPEPPRTTWKLRCGNQSPRITNPPRSPRNSPEPSLRLRLISGRDRTVQQNHGNNSKRHVNGFGKEILERGSCNGGLSSQPSTSRWSKGTDSIRRNPRSPPKGPTPSTLLAQVLRPHSRGKAQTWNQANAHRGRRTIRRVYEFTTHQSCLDPVRTPC